MLIALMCHDKPGATHIRAANRDAHLAYLKESDIIVAGPLLDDEETMVGSLIVLEAPDLEAARAWAAADPYAKADLFDRVDIRAWRKVVG